jgi:hypothetical protein
VAKVEVSWDSQGESGSLSGLIEDRSASGIGIQVPKPLPLGTRILVKLHEQELSAIVRRCIRAEFGFLVGASFEMPEERFVPQSQQAAEDANPNPSV